MKRPAIYTPEQLRDWSVSEEYKPGQWRMARPYQPQTLRLWKSFKTAWKVFTGEYDALRWDNSPTKQEPR